MSTTTCHHCAGSGYICERCGRANRRPESHGRRSFGKGCQCYRARSIRCRGTAAEPHVDTVHRCDGCGVVMLSLTFLHDKPRGSMFFACASCRESWEQWLSVAFEQWQATRAST